MSSTQKDNTIALDLASFTKEEIISASISTAVSMELPIAIWRMPHQSEIHLTISLGNARKLEKIDIDDLGTGFLFAPFHFGNLPALFIDADFSLSFDFEEVIQEHKTGKDESNDELGVLKAKFEGFLSQKSKVHSYHINPEKGLLSDTDYHKLIEKSVLAINENHFDKVVPARTKEISLAEGFNPVELLLNLCDSYANAFVSFVSIPEKGTWIGATPEVLIEKRQDSFKTIALAGTQRIDPLKSISDTSWTQKEIEEQAMVSRYIINCFKKIRLREFEEVGPKTVKAGNLLHLKTSYAVNTADTNFPELATVMLELLHPTSAVAGMPKEEALSFLDIHEGIDREFFSGFLGPVNVENSTDLFVNLRCMQLLENKAILYAGAGVTLDSQPEKEYQETELKFNTLLNILNKSL
ncbi:chorismate-binding protein [Roseivirga sp. E12]|uniref:chorismate-binding protein n=1 Tax=Roseivirga sp. E12 TaxID=2819237 RepID=UPI001ABC4C22|nr:chorismate-binding protein [Roseivirga sp. E12]MBO3700493.1 isochorismate synthase [Roseivirga sp. E12]